MFPLKDIGGFKIFLPRQEDIENGMKKVTWAQKANQDFLADYHMPERLPMQITGTFIYAHAPDYHGRPMLDANTDDWLCLFNHFKTLGMDTLCFQAALWNELNECYYTSAYFRDMLQFHVLEPMIQAAEMANMSLYLGGYGSVSGWSNSTDPATWKQEMKRHRICFPEISHLGRIDGFYFPCETAYLGKRNPKQEEKMHFLYKEFVSMVKEENSSRKVICSPGTKYFPGKEDEFAESWMAILEGVGMDILMPQDSVGTCSCPLIYSEKLWKRWHRISRQAGCRLWGNIELFERKSFTEEINLIPALPKRVAAQITNIAPFVEKLCCWEAGYFASDKAGVKGIRLKSFLEKSKMNTEK